MDNTQDYGEAYRDVIHEDAIRIGSATEQHLQNAFGQEYADYCHRVRRYL